MEGVVSEILRLIGIDELPAVVRWVLLITIVALVLVLAWVRIYRETQPAISWFGGRWSRRRSRSGDSRSSVLRATPIKPTIESRPAAREQTPIVTPLDIDTDTYRSTQRLLVKNHNSFPVQGVRATLLALTVDRDELDLTEVKGPARGHEFPWQTQWTAGAPPLSVDLSPEGGSAYVDIVFYVVGEPGLFYFAAQASDGIGKGEYWGVGTYLATVEVSSFEPRVPRSVCVLRITYNGNQGLGMTIHSRS